MDRLLAGAAGVFHQECSLCEQLCVDCGVVVVGRSVGFRRRRLCSGVSSRFVASLPPYRRTTSVVPVSVSPPGCYALSLPLSPPPSLSLALSVVTNRSAEGKDGRR